MGKLTWKNWFEIIAVAAVRVWILDMLLNGMEFWAMLAECLADAQEGR